MFQESFAAFFHRFVQIPWLFFPWLGSDVSIFFRFVFCLNHIDWCRYSQICSYLSLSRSGIISVTYLLTFFSKWEDLIVLDKISILVLSPFRYSWRILLTAPCSISMNQVKTRQVITSNRDFCILLGIMKYMVLIINANKCLPTDTRNSSQSYITLATLLRAVTQPE